MDLSISYLGIPLPNPLVVGASPMVDRLDVVKRLEDAGAAAIVMHSLFEEQITRERLGTLHHMDVHSESFAEALSYFPPPEEFHLGPEEYLTQIHRIKECCSIPLIASLNGTTDAGWTSYAQLLQQAGADALELNIYQLATNLWKTGESLEAQKIEAVKAVRRSVTIPVAVKLSPFLTSVANFARQLDEVGVAGLVLFNRFYQPDIDVEALEVVPDLHLSNSSELLLRLRWLAILSGRLQASLAVSGGVHTAIDAIKAIMAGASGVQMVSAILRNGPEHIKKVRAEMVKWMEEHEYESVSQMHGSMSLSRCPDPAAFERANYMRVLQSWRMPASA